MSYSIREVSEMSGIPATTLRYYEKEGLLPFVRRRESGYRIFSENDVSMLKVIDCLKQTGMSIKDIKKFTDLVQQGDNSLKERYELFIQRRKVVEQQIEDLQRTLKLIDYKCWYYETAIKAGTEKIHSLEVVKK